MNVLAIFAIVVCSSLPTAVVGGTPLYLGAINSYTGGGWDAGVQLETGQRLALDHIKAQNLLPGYDLDLVFGNGQCNAGVGLQFFINELYTDPTAPANGKKKVVGMIGPSCSGVCQAVSQTARYFNKLTVSGSCTSGALSDKGRFEYFLRTVPNDLTFVPVWMDMCKTHGWRRIATFAEDNALTLITIQEFRAKFTSEFPEVPIASNAIVTRTGSSHDFVKEIKRLGIKVIFATFYEGLGRNLICELYKNGLLDKKDMVIIGLGFYAPSTWHIPMEGDIPAVAGACTAAEMKKAVEGYIGFDVYTKPSDEWISQYLAKRAETEALPKNKAFEAVVESLPRDPATLNKMDSIYPIFHYDGVMAWAHTLKKMLLPTAEGGLGYNIGGGDTMDLETPTAQAGKDMLATMRGISFTGASGIVKYDDKGDRRGGAVAIKNAMPNGALQFAGFYVDGQYKWEDDTGTATQGIMWMNGKYGDANAPADGTCPGDGTCGNHMTQHVYGKYDDGSLFQVVATPRGKCDSGTCKCDPSWTGTLCEVAASTLNDEKDHSMSWIGSGIKGLVLALSGINISLALFCIIWTFVKKKAAAVKASQPEFLMMICLGCMVSSATIIPMTLDDNDGTDHVAGAAGIFIPDDADPTKGVYPEFVYGDVTNVTNAASFRQAAEVSPLNSACMAGIWLYSIGFIITFGSLFAKVYRVAKLFGNKKLKKIKVTVGDVSWPILVLLAIDGAILGAWQAVSPLVWQRKVLTSNAFRMPQESIGICGIRSPLSSGTLLNPASISSAQRISMDTPSQPIGGWAFLAPLVLLHVIVLLVGNVMSYRSRNISTKFQESKYIAICMVSNLQILVISIPILIIVGSNPMATVFVRAGVIFLNDLGVLMFIFVPKFGNVHFGWGQQYTGTTTATGQTGGTSGTASTSVSASVVVAPASTGNPV